MNNGSIGRPSHFLCNLSSSPLTLLKKINEFSHCSMLCFAHLDGHVPRARADHELEIEFLVGILLGELDGDKTAAGEQLRLPRQVGCRRGRVILHAHDVGLRIHLGQCGFLGVALRGTDLVVFQLGRRAHLKILRAEHRQRCTGVRRTEP